MVASHPDYNLWAQRFSSDGRWITFTAVRIDDASVSTLYAVSSSGGDWIPITEGKYWDDKGCWAPDSKAIYFLSSRTGFLNVWGTRFDPDKGKPVGQPFQVTTFESPAKMIYPHAESAEIAVSAERLVLPIAEVSGSIWMLENIRH